jgi:antitoxin HicB
MMSNMSYPLILERDEDDRIYLVSSPDLPELLAAGASQEQAVEQAAGALAAAVAARLKRREPMPAPSPARGRPCAVLMARLAAKVALNTALAETGMSNVALAKLLKVDEKQVRRMLDPAAPTKLDQIEAALAVLGRRLVVSVEAD